MVESKAIENTANDAVTNSAEVAVEEGQAGIGLPTKPTAEAIAGEMPAEPSSAAFNKVDSSVAALASETAPAHASEIVSPAPTSRPRLILRPHQRRHALLAASVAIAAAVGAVVGAVANGGASNPTSVNVAAVDENKVLEQSVARLSNEITNLKASFEAANKATHSQIAKISERLNRRSGEITGSITLPQAAPNSSVPNPTPRPASTSPERQPPAKVSIVPDWSIRGARNGYIYVHGHGDLYEVVPGAPLPGLGPVEDIKRQDGRWVVVTPKGIIVSMRDRRYFEQF
jgi:hypothetical protein